MKKNTTILFLLVISSSLYPLSFKQMVYNVRIRTARAVTKKIDAVQRWIEENPELSEQIVFASVLGVGSYWLLMRQSNPFADVVIKECHVCGASSDYNGVRLVQVQVPNQLDSDGGGAESCAYHAIHNAERIIALLTGRIRDYICALLNRDKINERFGPTGRWRRHIQRMRRAQQADANWRPRGDFVPGKSSRGGDWLHGEEIDSLMNRNTGIPRYPYDVVDDVAMLGLRVEPVRADRPDEAIGDPIVPAVRQALRMALVQGREYIHQFFINTAQHLYTGQDGAVSGYDGHWFSVVLHQSASGERTYIIADSYKNRLRLDDPNVHRLVDLIESE